MQIPFERNVRQRITQRQQGRYERGYKEWRDKAYADHIATTIEVERIEYDRIKPFIPIGLPTNDILRGFLRQNGTLTQRIDETLAITRLPPAVTTIVREYDADVNIDRLVKLTAPIVYSFCRTESQVQPGNGRVFLRGVFDDILTTHQPERIEAETQWRQWRSILSWKRVIARNWNPWFWHHRRRQTQTRTVWDTYLF
jgi:hypothetical protein